MSPTYSALHLMRAIHRAEVDQLRLMIADGADPNAQLDEWSPAMQACGDGQIRCLRVLIAAGADLDASGERGMTPLMVAAIGSEEACLAALLKAGVDLEKKDELGNTAAWCAAAYGNVKCLDRLIKAGADLDACLARPVPPSCMDVLAAELARREQVALRKATPRAKRSPKASRI